MNLDTRVRPNTADVAAKVLDGEAIMIDLKKGTYYSLDGVGTLVWQLIEGGYPLRKIVDITAQQFEVPADVAEADVGRLVQQMLDESLVERVHEQTPPKAAPVESTPENKLTYRAPELCIYRDMADLLALEPPTPGSAQEDLWPGSENEESG